jgi:hypothetical protein
MRLKLNDILRIIFLTLFLLLCIIVFYKDYTLGIGHIPKYYKTKGYQTIHIYSSQNRYGAYDKYGKLVKSGPAGLGKMGFKTKIGTYFFYTKRGGANCVSHKYGGKIPYCMFYYKGYAIHAGALKNDKGKKNLSHGCIHVSYNDAKWLHDVFAKGDSYKTTKIEIEDYDPRI